MASGDVAGLGDHPAGGHRGVQDSGGVCDSLDSGGVCEEENLDSFTFIGGDSPIDSRSCLACDSRGFRVGFTPSAKNNEKKGKWRKDEKARVLETSSAFIERQLYEFQTRFIREKDEKKRKEESSESTNPRDLVNKNKKFSTPLATTLNSNFSFSTPSLSEGRESKQVELFGEGAISSSCSDCGNSVPPGGEVTSFLVTVSDVQNSSTMPIALETHTRCVFPFSWTRAPTRT